MIELSLIIPVFNEEKKIAKDITEAAHFLGAQPFNSEVVIVDDGSQDKTCKVAQKLIRELSTDKVHLSLESYGENKGKGYAIQWGVEKASGEIIAFMDSGLCVPLRYILDGMKKIQSGADVALASRRHLESQLKVKQPLYRRTGSMVFWKLMRIAMGIDVSDTQCGFKFYRREVAQTIFPTITTEGFMFDIEALLIAKKKGLKVVEFGVEWANDADTRYHPIWGTFRNIKELVAIKRRGL